MTYKVFGGTLSLTQSINHCGGNNTIQLVHYFSQLIKFYPVFKGSTFKGWEGMEKEGKGWDGE